MTSRRVRIEIVYDMLCSIQNSNNKIKPTHLLYKSNLSHKKMKEYIGDLLKNKLVVERSFNSKKYFGLTEKGFNFIAEYRRVKAFADSFGL